MAGLYDQPQGGLFDPQTMMLLGLSQGLLQAGGPSRMPVGFGQALGQGMQSGMQAGMQGQQMQNQSQMQGLHAQLYGMQAKKLQADIDRQKMIAGVLGGQQEPTAPEGPTQLAGPTWTAGPQGGAPMPSRGDMMRRKGEQLINAGALAEGKHLIEAANALEPQETFSSPTTLVGPDGKPTSVMPGNRGTMKPVTGMSPYEKDDSAEVGRILDSAGITDPAQRQKIFADLASKKTTHQPPIAEVKVNNYTPASEEAQKDFIKSTRTTYDQLKSAPVALESIEKAKALIPSAKGFMGPGGETTLEAAKFLNNRLGMKIDTDGVKSAEELRTRIFFNIMDNLKKMDAQPSQMQQQIMADALGKLGTDPNALPQVLDAFGDVIRGKVDMHNKEVKGAVERGVKFPYDATINLESTAPKVKRYNPATGKIE